MQTKSGSRSVGLALCMIIGLPLPFLSGVVLAQSSPNPTEVLDNLEISGDFRVRYEYNSSYADTPSWERGVLRGRLAAHYALNDYFGIGGRVVTGNPDNPRTSDFAMRDFPSDTEISLDRACITYGYGKLFMSGGKFAKPFTSTEVVWDGDVNPQGLGGHYDLFSGRTWSARFSGVYFIIDQDVFDENSEMLGGQVSLKFQPSENWDLAFHSAYFDYDIVALDPDAPGGARGNNISPDGNRYVSDFNLLDTIGSVTYKGFGDRWNIRLIGDYVRNLGAEVPQDTAYGFDLFAGSLSEPGDFLYRYGYSRVETDAVLGMFSNDNIVIPTNYELHTLALDYTIRPHTFVGLTSYFFRRVEHGLDESAIDWSSRFRLNLYFTF